MLYDPVCMAEIDETEAFNKGLTSEFGNRRFYFCSDNCKHQFDDDPDGYVRTQDVNFSTDSGDYTDDYLG